MRGEMVRSLMKKTTSRMSYGGVCRCYERFLIATEIHTKDEARHNDANNEQK